MLLFSGEVSFHLNSIKIEYNVAASQILMYDPKLSQEVKTLRWLYFFNVVFLSALAMQRRLVVPLTLFELQRRKHKRETLMEQKNLTWQKAQ